MKLKTKNGELSLYAFSCGYVHTVGDCNMSLMSKECSMWQFTSSTTLRWTTFRGSRREAFVAFNKFRDEQEIIKNRTRL